MKELEMFINMLSTKDSSNKTIGSYTDALNKWFKYQNITTLEDLKMAEKYDIEKYDIYLKNKGLCVNTRFSYTMPIRSFYTYLLSSGIVETNPYHLSYKLKNKEDSEALDIEEIKLFLNSCKNIRSKAMFSLLFETGMRYCEISSIKVGDIKKDIHDDIETYFVKVTGKGNKDRCLGFSKTTYELIKDYISHDRCEVKSNQEILFVTKSGKVIQNKEMNYTFKSIVKKAGLQIEHPHFHQTRHSFCTTHIENGYDIKSVQNMMGHASSETTLKTYTHIKSKKLVDRMSANSLIY